VSGRDACTRGGTVVIDRMAGASSCHGVVVTGAGGAPAPSLLGQGRPVPPSLLEVVWNSSVESSIMAHRGDGDPLRVEPMKVVSESFLLEERLGPLK
jgi:hypothetical protein